MCRRVPDAPHTCPHSHFPFRAWSKSTMDRKVARESRVHEQMLPKQRYCSTYFPSRSIISCLWKSLMPCPIPSKHTLFWVLTIVRCAQGCAGKSLTTSSWGGNEPWFVMFVISVVYTPPWLTPCHQWCHWPRVCPCWAPAHPCPSSSIHSYFFLLKLVGDSPGSL